MKRPPVRDGKKPRWGAVDDDLLRKFAASGEPKEQIASAMGRSAASVKNRASKLKLSFRAGKRTTGRPKGSPIPNMLQRAAMQKLLSGDWKTAHALLPTQEISLLKMVERGWLERCEQSSGSFYRLSAFGLETFRAPLA